MDWKSIDKDRCCIGGIYDDSSFEYFPTVENGVLDESGLAKKILPLAREEMHKYYPTAGDAWCYLNFLLKTSICYVEYTGYNGQLKKSLMCSNINIIKECNSLHGVVFTESRNVSNFNGTHVNGEPNKLIKALKINKKLLTEPKVPMYLKNAVIRVVPIGKMYESAQRILNDKRIMRYTYFKDNGSERTLVTTCDRTILLRHYTSEKSSEMLDSTCISVDTLINRGYIKVLELGASKYDSGVRALNIAKIKSYEEITDDEVDYRFVDVDFSTIVDTFKFHIERQSDIELLNNVNKDLNPDAKESTSKPYILNALFQVVDSNVVYGSTQYLRELYLYMADHPNIFGASVVQSFDFNMGVSNIDITDGGTFTFEDMALGVDTDNVEIGNSEIDGDLNIGIDTGTNDDIDTVSSDWTTQNNSKIDNEVSDNEEKDGKEVEVERFKFE